MNICSAILLSTKPVSVIRLELLAMETDRDSILFQISARNQNVDEFISRMGEDGELTKTANGYIWHLEVETDTKYGSFKKLVNRILDRFVDQKDFLYQLRQNGSDLTFIWFPVPRDNFYVLGVDYETITKLSNYGIALNCTYFSVGSATSEPRNC